MESPDIKAFLFFGVVGLMCGLLAALAFKRSRHPMLWTALSSAIGGTIGGLLVGFVLETIHSITTGGHSFADAVQSGLAASFILAFVSPFVCGGPAAIVGCLVQLCLQRARRRDAVSQPPPLPD